MSSILFSSLILLLLFINPTQGEEEDFNQCGRFSLTGEYSYFCALYVRTGKSSIFLGGGTLIQRNQILSLATLFTNLKILGEGSPCDGYSPNYSLFARCGGQDLQLIREETTEPSSLDRPIQKILLHPSYNKRNLTNDYAILITTEPFQYSSELGRVCLPNPGESETDIFTKDCQALGHGKDGEDIYENSYSSLLRKVELSVVKSEDCEEILNTKHFQNLSLGGADNSWRWKIDESFLCAGGVAGLDTCEGDGGGPLLCKRFDVQEVLADSGLNATFVQVGVTAWGVGCGRGIPGVYSRIFSAICWIKQVMRCYPEEENSKNLPDLENAGDLIDLRNEQDSVDTCGQPKSCGCTTEFQENFFELRND